MLDNWKELFIYDTCIINNYIRENIHLIPTKSCNTWISPDQQLMIQRGLEPDTFILYPLSTKAMELYYEIMTVKTGTLEELKVYINRYYEYESNKSRSNS